MVTKVDKYGATVSDMCQERTRSARRRWTASDRQQHLHPPQPAWCIAQTCPGWSVYMKAVISIALVDASIIKRLDYSDGVKTLRTIHDVQWEISWLCVISNTSCNCYMKARGSVRSITHLHTGEVEWCIDLHNQDSRNGAGPRVLLQVAEHLGAR